MGHEVLKDASCTLNDDAKGTNTNMNTATNTTRPLENYQNFDHVMDLTKVSKATAGESSGPQSESTPLEDVNLDNGLAVPKRFRSL